MVGLLPPLRLLTASTVQAATPASSSSSVAASSTVTSSEVLRGRPRGWGSFGALTLTSGIRRKPYAVRRADCRRQPLRGDRARPARRARSSGAHSRTHPALAPGGRGSIGPSPLGRSASGLTRQVALLVSDAQPPPLFTLRHVNYQRSKLSAIFEHLENDT